MKNLTLLGAFAGAIAGMGVAHFLKQDKAIGAVAGLGLGYGVGYAINRASAASAERTAGAGASKLTDGSFPVEGAGFGTGGGPMPPVGTSAVAGLGAYIRSPWRV